MSRKRISHELIVLKWHPKQNTIQEKGPWLKRMLQNEPPDLSNWHLRSMEREWAVWNVQFRGPKGTPYENGVFNVHISFPVDYPFRPPMIMFDTRIVHPQITCFGDVCSVTDGRLGDMFTRNGWNPGLSVAHLLHEIETLVRNPTYTDDVTEEVCRKATKTYADDVCTWEGDDWPKRPKSSLKCTMVAPRATVYKQAYRAALG